jgi:hypothetical protein
MFRNLHCSCLEMFRNLHCSCLEMFRNLHCSCLYVWHVREISSWLRTEYSPIMIATCVVCNFGTIPCSWSARLCQVSDPWSHFRPVHLQHPMFHFSPYISRRTLTWASQNINHANNIFIHTYNDLFGLVNSSFRCLGVWLADYSHFLCI